MKVYLVWDGYEDVEAAFLCKEKADAFVAEKKAKYPMREFGFTDCEIRDWPEHWAAP